MGDFSYLSDYIINNIGAVWSVRCKYPSVGNILCAVLMGSRLCRNSPSSRSHDETGRHIPAATRLQCVWLPHTPESTSAATTALPTATVSSTTACSSVWRSLQRLLTATSYCPPSQHDSHTTGAPRQSL